MFYWISWSELIFLAKQVSGWYCHVTARDQGYLNMALSILYLALDLLLTVAAFSPVPRITWDPSEINLIRFHEPEVFNYSVLLLSEDVNVLYVGAREAIFAVNSLDIAEKQHEVYWKASEDQKNECTKKGKSKQTECFNYVRVLQQLNEGVLYVCGTNAFQPTCDHLSLTQFELVGRNEDGKGKSPFDPMQSYTSVMVDGELYSGTSFTFLGNEPIIFKQSQQNQLRTEYSVLWLNDPNFVSADVIRHSQNMPRGDDDKVYFFFTEVSVEFEFVGKLMIPRVARVCKGDQGGLRILQKKWTTFLKATLLCRLPEWNFIFNVVNDVFILKSPSLKEPLIYGVFAAQLNNIGVSAVCAYNMSSVEEVFAKGKYMQSATVEQSDTKWVRFNGEIPKPRPGACINSFDRTMNYNSSLGLPDKTLQFIKDHPLMYDSVTPLGNKPQLVKRDVNYTQIVVDRVKALDSNIYNIMFISTDEGTLHKAISSENGMHIIEEVKLFSDSEPIQTLLLSSKENQRYIYAGSNSGVVQSPVAFCEKYPTCVDCVLARDPYCAWNSYKLSCVNVLQEGNTDRDLIQHINGDAAACYGKDTTNNIVVHHKLNLGSTAELRCSPKSNLARVVWKFESRNLNLGNPKYRLLKDALLIFNVMNEDTGVYQCLSEEKGLTSMISQVVAQHAVELQRPLHTTTRSTLPATKREGNIMTPKLSSVVTEGSTVQPAATQVVMTTPTGVTDPASITWASLASDISAAPEILLEKTSYLIKPNDSSLFLFLFLLFFALFCCLFAYNCYRGFLPKPCLKFRSTLLPSKPAADFSDCEQGLKETLVEQSDVQNQNGEQLKPSQDTGYETEPDYGNGRIPHQDESQKIEDDHNKDKPFDVMCDIKYADSDVEGD